jgi:hypothetical protein
MDRGMTFENEEKKMNTKGRYGRAAKSALLVLVPILLLHALLTGYTEKSAVRKVPFQPGEKLTYHGRWGIIEAGEVTLEVLPREIINGIEVYHFAMTTKTNEVVDLIYKIRERQDSYVDMNMTHSILYKKKTESKHPRDETIAFNWEKNEAIYTNFGETKPPIHIPPGTFDPLALFFALRAQKVEEGSVIRIPITDGNKTTLIAKATVGKKQTIDINGTTYDTYEIDPDMESIENAVKSNESLNLRIWLTADDKKIPVKIQSRVGIITFVFEIVSIFP